MEYAGQEGYEEDEAADEDQMNYEEGQALEMDMEGEDQFELGMEEGMMEGEGEQM